MSCISMDWAVHSVFNHMISYGVLYWVHGGCTAYLHAIGMRSLHRALGLQTDCMVTVQGPMERLLFPHACAPWLWTTDVLICSDLCIEFSRGSEADQAQMRLSNHSPAYTTRVQTQSSHRSFFAGLHYPILHVYKVVSPSLISTALSFSRSFQKCIQV